MRILCPRTHTRPATIRSFGSSPPTPHKLQTRRLYGIHRRAPNAQHPTSHERRDLRARAPTEQPTSTALRTQSVSCPRDIFRQTLNDANHFTQFMVLLFECVRNAQPHLFIINPRCAIALRRRLQNKCRNHAPVASPQPTDPIRGTLTANTVLASLRLRHRANAYEHTDANKNTRTRIQTPTGARNPTHTHARMQP